MKFYDILVQNAMFLFISNLPLTIIFKRKCKAYRGGPSLLFDRLITQNSFVAAIDTSSSASRRTAVT